jgi:hypothetical protein
MQAERKEQALLNIIDALTAGFNTITRRLWLMLIPVALDVYLWQGPKLSIARLVKRLEPLLTPAANIELSKSDAYNLAMSREAFIEMGESFNLFSLLSNTFLGVPNLLVVSPQSLNPNQPTMEVANGWMGLGLVVAFVLISVVIACFYLEMIAQIVRDGRVGFENMPQRVLSVSGRVVALGIILLLIILVLILPVSIFLTLVALVSQGVAIMLLGMFSLMVFWGSIIVMVYLFYVIYDLLINETGLLQSVWNSVMMVRRNLWPTLGLILLTNVLSAGLMLVWQRLTFASWGMVIAIVGNAFIGTGLVAAIMLFYMDRFRTWQEDLSNIPQTASDHP